MAQIQRQPGPGLLVHSDRGVQYASEETRQFLAAHDWQASMSRTANPYDNAWMESAIGKIKNDHAAARQQLFIGIECWYNQRRRHSALGYQSPVAFEAKSMNN
jgi:putative transposase